MEAFIPRNVRMAASTVLDAGVVAKLAVAPADQAIKINASNQSITELDPSLR